MTTGPSKQSEELLGASPTRTRETINQQTPHSCPETRFSVPDRDRFGTLLGQRSRDEKHSKYTDDDDDLIDEDKTLSRCPT